MNSVGRLNFLDWARGVALLAMTIYHFAFDLEMFGIQEPGFISQPHWKIFARAIASSFLILAGFSLYLAHARAIRWASWRMRMIKIVAAAILITVATWFATPHQYIFFGILHAIAFASLAGLLFLRVPVVVTVLVAIAIFFIGQTWETAALNHWIFWWTGLSDARVVSSDFVPVFPWLSAPLLGIAAAKFSMSRNWLAHLAIPKFSSRIGELVRFIGRNSLVYYLLHQPVMIGLLLAFLYMSGRM